MSYVSNSLYNFNVSNNFEASRESTKGYSRWKVELRHGKFKQSDFNNKSTSKSQKRDGAEPDVQKGKHSSIFGALRYKK